MWNLAGKVSVVTGGARGIGLATARMLGAAGSDVVVVDLSQPEEAASAMKPLVESGVRTRYIQADVSSEPQVRSMVQAVMSVFGGIDVLINNAGVLSVGLVVDLPASEWDRVLAVNLRGTFLCSRAVLPTMLERRGGRIINIASQLGQTGGAGRAHYSASKGGVIAFTKALAREVAEHNVLVNAVAPGVIATEMLREESPEWRNAKLSEIPIGRFGEPDEVAAVAVFLASQGGSFFVGQTLCPNGGEVMV